MGIKVEVRGDPRRRRTAIKKSRELAEKKHLQGLMKSRTTLSKQKERKRTGMISKGKIKAAAKRKK